MDKIATITDERGIKHVARERLQDQHLGVEQLLDILCKFGEPRLGVYGSGWHCSIKMHVSCVGSDFEIRSEFGCPTQIAAVRQCCDRVYEVLTKISC